MLLDTDYQLRRGSTVRAPKHPQQLIINNNLFDTSSLDPQLAALLEYLVEKNLKAGTTTRNFWSREEILQNMKGNAQKMMRQEALTIMWNELFPEQRCPQNIDRQLSAIQYDIARTNYDTININKPLQDAVQEEIEQLQFEGRRLQEDLLQMVKVTRNKVSYQRNLAKDLTEFLKCIFRREIQVFADSVVALEEIDDQAELDGESLITGNQTYVNVYFEQAYPLRTMLKDQLVEIMGMDRYQRKIANMPIMDQLKKQRLRQNAVISCHFCRKILISDDALYQCSIELSMQSLQPTLLTNPELYHEILHGYDYVDPIYSCRAIKPTYSHPYLTYHHYLKKGDKESQLRPICRRVYCQNCYISQVLENNPNGLLLDVQDKVFICRYCEGSCKCRRCSNMDFVIKATAYYMRMGGSLKQVLDGCYVFPECKKKQLYLNRIKGIGEKKLEKKKIKQLKEKALAVDLLIRIGVLKPHQKQNDTYRLKCLSGQLTEQFHQETRTKNKTQKKGMFRVTNSKPLIPTSKISLGLSSLKSNGQIGNTGAKLLGEQLDSESWSVSDSNSSSYGQVPKPLAQLERRRPKHIEDRSKDNQADKIRRSRLQQVQKEYFQRKQRLKLKKLRQKQSPSTKLSKIKESKQKPLRKSVSKNQQKRDTLPRKIIEQNGIQNSSQGPDIYETP